MDQLKILKNELDNKTKERNDYIIKFKLALSERDNLKNELDLKNFEN